MHPLVKKAAEMVGAVFLDWAFRELTAEDAWVADGRRKQIRRRRPPAEPKAPGEASERTIDICPRCGRALFTHVGRRCPK